MKQGELLIDLNCDVSVAAGYKSASQQARVISEAWYLKNAYCLACDSDEVKATKRNTPANDFVCPKCGHRYELKAFKRRPRKALNDGAYKTMMEGISAFRAPTLCLMERTVDWQIRSWSAIHSGFLVPNVIVKRKALSDSAQRKGYVGCTIRLDQIAPDAEISVIDKCVIVKVEDVRRRFQRFNGLGTEPIEQRGWTLLTLWIVRRLRKASFTLAEVYQHEAEFAKVYPANLHIRDKIRQQLQVLRDLGVLVFEERGTYRLLS